MGLYVMYRLSYDCRYRANSYSYKVDGVYDIASAIHFLYFIKDKKHVSFQKLFLNDTIAPDEDDSLVLFSGAVSESEVLETAKDIQTNLLLLFVSYCGEAFAIFIDTSTWYVNITLQKENALDIMEIEKLFLK